MKTIFLNGGLGNNLFQLCFALSMSKRVNSVRLSQLLLDATYLKKAFGITDHKNLLRYFEWPRVDIASTSADQWMAVAACFLAKNTRINVPLIALDEMQHSREGFSRKKYFLGVWTSERWLDLDCSKEIVLKQQAIRPEVLRLADSIRNDYIGCHLRLGDYNNPGVRKVLGQVSFDSIASYTRGKKVFLMSNGKVDVAQLRATDVLVASSLGLNDIEEFYLFGQLGSKVIANSTFSWWAALLGRHDAEVFAPRPFFRGAAFDVYPRSWCFFRPEWL